RVSVPLTNREHCRLPVELTRRGFVVLWLIRNWGPKVWRTNRASSVIINHRHRLSRFRRLLCVGKLDQDKPDQCRKNNVPCMVHAHSPVTSVGAKCESGIARVPLSRVYPLASR